MIISGRARCRTDRLPAVDHPALLSLSPAPANRVNPALLNRLRSSVSIDLRDLRVAGAAMLFLAAALPLVPGYPGVPCLLRTFTGIPCPFCGMSTSVKETVRLQLRDAWAANPAGVVAVVIAVTLIVVRPRSVRLPALLISTVLAAMWIFQLFRFSIL